MDWKLCHLAAPNNLSLPQQLRWRAFRLSSDLQEAHCSVQVAKDEKRGKGICAHLSHLPTGQPERTLPAGLLQPLCIPFGLWVMATMDFINGLPPSRHYNCILVVVDKFSKYAHFIPLKHPYTASKVVELFVDTIYRLHGMPKALVSDRDPVFTSQFWHAVFKSTGTELRMSTGHHPETDGQAERVNQSIECYLRCFIGAHPQQWSKWLGL